MLVRGDSPPNPACDSSHVCFAFSGDETSDCGPSEEDDDSGLEFTNSPKKIGLTSEDMNGFYLVVRRPTDYRVSFPTIVQLTVEFPEDLSELLTGLSNQLDSLSILILTRGFRYKQNPPLPPACGWHLGCDALTKETTLPTGGNP